MKLSVWAKQNGISYRTAQRWVATGKMPVEVERMPSGTIIVKENNNINRKNNVIVYARVSSPERKTCLDGQVENCVSFANASGLSVDKIYKEIASGMNDKRPMLLKILNSNPTHIIVEHKDRLTRFGFNYLEVLLAKQNCEIIVLNRDEENESDLIKDTISIMTSFCCRLYGLRRGHHKAAKIKETIEND